MGNGWEWLGNGWGVSNLCAPLRGHSLRGHSLRGLSPDDKKGSVSNMGEALWAFNQNREAPGVGPFYYKKGGFIIKTPKIALFRKRGRLLTKKSRRRECLRSGAHRLDNPNHFPTIPNHFLYILIGFMYKSIYFIEFPINFLCFGIILALFTWSGQRRTNQPLKHP